jgi:hypothetical protein
MNLSLDHPTLRTQLDQLIRDHEDFSQGLIKRQEEIERLTRELEQYRGALSYIRVARQRIEAELTATNPPAS